MVLLRDLPPNSPPSVTTPPKKKAQKTEAGKGTGSLKSAVQPQANVGPDATAVWDLKGDGDCFRILAAQARRNGAAVSEKGKIEKLALSLRTKCGRQSWFVDTDATVFVLKEVVFLKVQRNTVKPPRGPKSGWTLG